MYSAMRLRALKLSVGSHRSWPSVIAALNHDSLSRSLLRVMGACGPPGASRCSARASLRTPSRPHPPHEDALRAIGAGLCAYLDVFRYRTFARSDDRGVVDRRWQAGICTDSFRKGGSDELNRAQRDLSGGWGREGVRSTPKRGSPRGVGSEARAQQRLAPGGRSPQNPWYV